MYDKATYIKKAAITVILFFAGCSLFAVEPIITVKAMSESRFVYEPFYLQVDVTSDEELDRPVIEEGDGYTVASISHGYRSPYNKKSIMSFRVEIVASEKGTLTIAPAVITIGEKSLSTSPLRLVVDEPHRAEECYIEIAFSSTNLYVDQAVEMNVKWYSKTPLIQYRELMLDIPVLRNDGFVAYPVDPDFPEKQRIGVPVNAQRIIARKMNDAQGESLAFKYMLVAKKAGRYSFDELRIASAFMLEKESSNQYPSYFNNNFFAHPDAGNRFERVYQTVSIPALEVSALPEKGRTSLYCGVAGGLSAAASINPVEAVVGQPMMYEVTLTNMAFGRQLAALPDAVLENIGPSFKLTLEPIHESVSVNSHHFVYAVRPLRCDIDYVPGLAIQIFDVERGAYRMVRTAPLPISVLPDGDKKVYTPDRGGAKSGQKVLSGIRANRKQSVVLMNGYEMIEFIGRRAFLIWLLAPVAWLLIRKRVRHLERCRTDADYARASKALSRFRRLLAEDEDFALREYIADRFGLCAEAMTQESCASELEAHGLCSEVVQMARDYFESLDVKKYSPVGDKAESRIGVKKLVKAIDRATKALVLLLFLMPLLTLADNASHKKVTTLSGKCSGGSQSRIDLETATHKFTAAMALQAARPDEACPLFVESALAFESAGFHFNAGNSWFFAGESGRALAAYLAAESRAPFNREISEGIAFIRAQRPDDFPASGGLSSVIVTMWQQLCRWNIYLRLGFLSVLYMSLWCVYILSRIWGFKLDRRFWTGCGVVLGFILITILYSLLQPERGVVIQSVGARLGPGYAYAPAYEGVLHPAVEFEWLAEEGGWVSARLPDDNTVWLHESTCVKVR
jgi:hypothetical protein